MLRITIILLCSLFASSLVSQDFRFNNYKKTDLQLDALDERFTKYQVVDFPFNYGELQKKDGQVIASQFFFIVKILSVKLLDRNLSPKFHIVSCKHLVKIASANLLD